MQVPQGVSHDVNRVPSAEKPEINASSFGRNNASQKRECAKGEVSQVNKLAHVKQSEHQAVSVDDAGHIVKGIHSEKQNGEPECTLLNRGERLFHVGPGC